MGTNLHQHSWHTNVAELEGLIRYHQRLYYDLNAPEISDADFDAMWERLNELAPHSPVLMERSQFDADYQHAFPMGSLEKCKTPEEIVRRLGGKSRDNKGTVTAKLDGASLTVHYENGRIVRAVTRGRTETGKGKIVTANALAIPSIPRTIPINNPVEVRGECVILLSDWASIADKYKNPRNAASGGLSCQDPRETAARKITFVACKVVRYMRTIIDTQPLAELVNWGFVVPRAMDVDLSSVEGVKELIETWLECRSSLDYWNDGIVVRIADQDVYNSLGFSGVCPNGACAYKFENERARTVLRRIETETGRLGFVTPVAVFDPVELGGATVERCSLHNWEWMRVHGNPSIGAEITVEKCGDIIPGLASVEKPGNGDTGEPVACPSCGCSPLVRVDTQDGEGRKLKCANGMACPAQRRDAILNILRKLEIKGMAETTLDKIVAAGLVKDPWDIFAVSDDLSKAGLGDGEIRNILGELRGRQGKPTNILAAVGVEGWGRRMFAKLQKNAPAFTDDRLLSGDFPYEEVRDAVGPAKARVLSLAFAEGSYHRLFLQGLLKWVAPVAKEAGDATNAVGGSLSGKTFLLTGTLSKSRKLVEADIVAAGGAIASGVSKNLDFLVVGDDPGSKVDKAAKLGVKTLDEAELYAMIGG
jgi:DNA ligase (NAD+)